MFANLSKFKILPEGMISVTVGRSGRSI